MSDTPAQDEAPPPVKIKKYANRRLYNTGTSSYVTLDHLCQMVKEGVDFIVHDAKTGEDITRAVLTQIIVEEEAKGGQNLLPVSFLRQLISFYGNSLQALVPRYLSSSMNSFASNQDQMRQYLSSLGGLFPFGQQFEEMGKQNMALFQNAMNMFSPFKFNEDKAGASPATTGPGATGGTDDLAELQRLQRELEEMQKRLGAISRKQKPDEPGKPE
jgi:polyhydroxyalkanoate synthesis repressor PhaR